MKEETKIIVQILLKKSIKFQYVPSNENRTTKL
jgi:hypothetical protein